MATITTRAGKGSPLTYQEVDANFTNLNAGKADRLLLTPSDLAGSQQITAGNLVITPAPASIPSGQSVTVDPEAEWLLLEDERSVVQYDSYFGRWDSVSGVRRNLVGTTDVQTLENKTLSKPAIADPVITGGTIVGTDITIPVAVSHTHTVNSAVTIPPASNALSVAPITIQAGGSVAVGAGTSWKFLWI